MTMLNNGSYYGSYRQVRFTDVFPDADTFMDEYHESEVLNDYITDGDSRTIYYLLYSHYGNSTIASSDTNRFKYSLWTTIFSFAPTWKAKLKIQDELRALLNDPDSLFAGVTQINNHAYNPGTPPSTGTTEEVEGINEQHVTKYKKDKMAGYAMLWQLLENDVTMDFLNKFKKLFLTIVQPERPLWYVSDIEGGEEDV